MSVLNTFQYKQCVSCQNVIVYRPDEKNSRGANGLNEVSVNVKTKNALNMITSQFSYCLKNA